MWGLLGFAVALVAAPAAAVAAEPDPSAETSVLHRLAARWGAKATA